MGVSNERGPPGACTNPGRKGLIVITVETYVKIQGTDGKWYTPAGGMPNGITWTGEKRLLGYVLRDGGCTYGPIYEDLEEAEHIAAFYNRQRQG